MASQVTVKYCLYWFGLKKSVSVSLALVKDQLSRDNHVSTVQVLGSIGKILVKQGIIM